MFKNNFTTMKRFILALLFMAVGLLFTNVCQASTIEKQKICTITKCDVVENSTMFIPNHNVNGHDMECISWLEYHLLKQPKYYVPLKIGVVKNKPEKNNALELYIRSNC